MGSAEFRHIDALPERAMMEGVHLRILPGEKLMFSVVRFEPNSTVPTHQHPHEQLGIILEGEMELWINDDRRTLRRGDAYVIPSNVPHGGETKNTTCLVLDAFHPLREEYVKLFKQS